MYSAKMSNRRNVTLVSFKLLSYRYATYFFKFDRSQNINYLWDWLDEIAYQSMSHKVFVSKVLLITGIT